MAVRSVLLYGSETWPLKAEYIRRLCVFDHCGLRSIGKIRWEHGISNTHVKKFLESRDISTTKLLNIHRLWGPGHVIRMSTDCSPRWALFTESSSRWKRPSGGQHITWQNNMNYVTEGFWPFKLCSVNRNGMTHPTHCTPVLDVIIRQSNVFSHFPTWSVSARWYPSPFLLPDYGVC